MTLDLLCQGLNADLEPQLEEDVNLQAGDESLRALVSVKLRAIRDTNEVLAGPVVPPLDLR